MCSFFAYKKRPDKSDLFSVGEKIRTPGLLVRSQTLYPAELRPHIQLSYLTIQMLFTSKCRRRNRTGTRFNSNRILSPARLPVPPLRHIHTLIIWHISGTNRTRTYDPLLVRQMLSQLSYDPKRLV